MPPLPYATVKPHTPDTCPDRHGPLTLCHPQAPGHWACQNPACPNGPGHPATLHTLRHATTAEYAALPLAHIPIDRLARQAVFMCDDCAEDTEAHAPFCTHPPAVLPPCPKCGAPQDQACVKKDGVTTLGFTHAARPPKVYERCTHAHRPDCSVFEDCACSGDDQPPTRPQHPAQSHIDGPGPDISKLLFEPELAQLLLQHRGVHWWQVRSVESRRMQDGRPCLWAEVATVDDGGHLRYDEHGHEIRQEVVIPIVAPPPGQLGQPAHAAIDSAGAAPAIAPPAQQPPPS